MSQTVMLYYPSYVRQRPLVDGRRILIEDINVC